MDLPKPLSLTVCGFEFPDHVVSYIVIITNRRVAAWPHIRTNISTSPTIAHSIVGARAWPGILRQGLLNYRLAYSRISQRLRNNRQPLVLRGKNARNKSLIASLQMSPNPIS
jgi:hypothetical protein